MRFINRDWRRTEHDDFVLNVEPILSPTIWATPHYGSNGELLGWQIKGAYE